MKKALFILLLLQGLSAAAQIRIGDFRQVFSDGTAAAVRTGVPDPDGLPCAVLKLETRLSGWTFDAGLAGIMDTRYESGTIWLYIPAGARKLTVAHKEYGVLRDWPFPVPLESGRTYSMTLSYERPRQTAVPKAAPARTVGAPAKTTRQVATAPAAEERRFSDHFTDLWLGIACSNEWGGGFEADGDLWCGFSYTWIGNRVGPYASVGINLDEGFAVIGGAAFRLTDPSAGALDWQLYGGAGLIDGSLGAEVGTRFGWRSSYRLSHWDFGFGCQFTRDRIIPTVSVGLYIWGIPVMVGLGVVCCVL